MIVRSASFREHSPPAISLDQWDFGKRPSQAILAIELSRARSYSNMFHESAATEFQLGIYGWRKRLLYLLLFILSWLMISNLVLTFWVLRVFHFSLDGIANMKIEDDSVRINADTHFHRGIYTNHIRHSAKWEQNHEAYDPFLKTNSLLLEANEKVQLRSVGRETFNEISVGQAEFAVSSDDFSVFNLNEELLFRVTNDSLHVKHTTIHVENGVRLEASLQTPLVRGGNRLLLESPLGRVILSSPGPVLVESRTGDVYLVAHSNITFKSRDQLYFDSSDIRLRGLLPDVRDKDRFAYPLCICSSGKLFLGDSDSGSCTEEGQC